MLDFREDGRLDGAPFPWHNISVLNASFPSSTPKRSELQTTSAYLLPSFKYVPFLPRVSFDSVQALAKGISSRRSCTRCTTACRRSTATA
ncbi:FMI1 protein [Colletotrichum tofieldiae]|nr:FMI1 protein [Colletotrichum tofieldiae]